MRTKGFLGLSGGLDSGVVQQIPILMPLSGTHNLEESCPMSVKNNNSNLPLCTLLAALK